MSTLVPESPSKSRSRKQIALALALVLAGVVALTLIELWDFYASSYFGVYVCSYCGLGRTLHIKRVAAVTYFRRITLEDTALSRALNPGRKQGCRHVWYRIHYGVSCRWGTADGWTRFLEIHGLTHDEGFARQLAAMPHARQVWHAIIVAGEKSPREIHSLIDGWRDEGPDRPPFAQWWAANEKRVRQLGSGSRRRG